MSYQTDIWAILPPWPTEAPRVDHAEVKAHAHERKGKSKKGYKYATLRATFVGGPRDGAALRMDAEVGDTIMMHLGTARYDRRRNTNEWHYVEQPPRTPEPAELELLAPGQ